MRKNPAFVRQLAAFVDHKTALGAHNGTSAEQHVAAALPEVAAGSGNNGLPPPLREKDQTIVDHMDVGRDDYEDDDGAKHLDARQAARQSFASSSSSGHRKATTFDDDDDDSEADPSTKSEDGQTSAEKE
jgi:hypothetical protein